MTSPGPIGAPPRLTVVVTWDGGSRQASYPPDLALPHGTLLTLTPGTLAPPHDPDALLDDLCRWVDAGPTVLVTWEGLPADLLRRVRMTARVLGSDRVAVLHATPGPMAAMAVGWRLVLLAQADGFDLRHARALGPLLASETRTNAVLSRPHRSRLIDLGGFGLLRSVRRGTKLIRWMPQAAVSRFAPGTPLLYGEPTGAPRGALLAFVARAGDGVVVELSTSPGDAVVEMQPGSLDPAAWGQRTYTEIAVTPRGVGHLHPAISGRRLCRSCERMTAATSGTCDGCTLRSSGVTPPAASMADAGT